MPRGFCLYVALAFVGAAFVAPGARANPVSVINALRAGACRTPGVKSSPLVPTQALDRVAQRIAAGATLRDAMAQSGFRARASRTLAVSGISGDAAFRTLAEQRFCHEIGEADLTGIGFARSGDKLLIVLAEPFTAPALARPERVRDEVLRLVNLARSQPRSCGSGRYAPAAPLTLSNELDTAAEAHADDMTRRDQMTHEGSDGSSPGERALRAGFRWRVVGENVAAGPDSAQQVMTGWLASPEHCANIMDPRFTRMGLAYRVDWSRKSGVYWAQEFGVPR